MYLKIKQKQEKMSANERARHLEQFVAESEPPPLAQHLPPMPSASQRFAAIQQQQLAAQRQGGIINYIDPYSHGKAGDREFNPFQSLVLQNQEDSESTDSEEEEETSETTDDTEPVPPKKPIKVAVPRKIPVTPLPQKTPPPPPPPVVPVVAAPVVVPQEKPLVATLPPQQQLVVPAAPAPVEEEPRGIMDQSMAFLKKNFWAILTVIVVLVALGVAFIYFARPKANETALKIAPQVKAIGPPGAPMRYSNVENEIVAPAEEITKLQKEKQSVEETNDQLQKRVQSVEEEVKKASEDQKAHLRDIEKLQKMCEQLETEKEKLKENNTQMAEFIMQNNLLPEETPNPTQKDEHESSAVVSSHPNADASKEGELPTEEGVANHTDFEKIDVEAIEKSAVDENQFQTVDETQHQNAPVAEKKEEIQEEKEEGGEGGEEEEIQEEKLPWQK